MPTIDTCNLLVTPDGLKVRLSLDLGFKGDIELTPDQADALANRLREAAVKVREGEAGQDAAVVRELFRDGG
jgi:hypothetical protein